MGTVLAVVVVVVALLTFVLDSSSKPFVREVSIDPYVCSGHGTCSTEKGHTSSIREPTSREDFRRLAQRRFPLLLRNLSLVRAWPATRSWSLHTIERHLPVVPAYSKHRSQSSTFITFHDDRPLEPLLASAKWDDFNLKQNTTVRGLLNGEELDCLAYAWEPWLARKCTLHPAHPERAHQDRSQEHGSRQRWLYFSASTRLLSEFWPSLEAEDEEVRVDAFRIAETGFQANLWMGSAGIVTHTHFDASWNFFAQIQGRKRFTLFSPDIPLPVYPCLHPHMGHVVPDILDSQAWAPSNLTALVADLKPGDVLIVPPMWFHQYVLFVLRVVCVACAWEPASWAHTDTAVSMNVFSAFFFVGALQRDNHVRFHFVQCLDRRARVCFHT